MAHLVSAKIDLPLQLQLIIFIYELKIEGGAGTLGFSIHDGFLGEGSISTRNDDDIVGDTTITMCGDGEGTWGFGLKLRL